MLRLATTTSGPVGRPEVGERRARSPPEFRRHAEKVAGRRSGEAVTSVAGNRRPEVVRDGVSPCGQLDKLVEDFHISRPTPAR